ncbi:hypothetical protein ACFL2Q_01185 [Thermodesulfobacteriota bacterium]
MNEDNVSRVDKEILLSAKCLVDSMRSLLNGLEFRFKRELEMVAAVRVLAEKTSDVLKGSSQVPTDES